MLKYSRWIFTGLLILTVTLVSCKLISVENQRVNVVVSVEHPFSVWPPNHTTSIDTINIENYWPDGFDGWSVESAELNDVLFSVSGVSPQDSTKSANFIAEFRILPPTTTVKDLLGTTQTLTLGEILRIPMSVWNNKVTIDPAGRAKWIAAVSNRQSIEVTVTTQNPTGVVEFSGVITIKVQLGLKSPN